MPIAFIAIGALFLIAAVRGTINDYGNGQAGLLTLLKSDFVSSSAQGNFLVWLVTLWIIGALGYIPGFKPIANALLFLVILVLVLSNSKGKGPGGIFAEFNAALTSGASNNNNSIGPSPNDMGAGIGQGVNFGTGIVVGGTGSGITGIGAMPAEPSLPSLPNFLPGGQIQVPGFQGVGTYG